MGLDVTQGLSNMPHVQGPGLDPCHDPTHPSLPNDQS